MFDEVGQPRSCLRLQRSHSPHPALGDTGRAASNLEEEALDAEGRGRGTAAAAAQFRWREVSTRWPVRDAWIADVRGIGVEQPPTMRRSGPEHKGRMAAANRQPRWGVGLGLVDARKSRFDGSHSKNLGVWAREDRRTGQGRGLR